MVAVVEVIDPDAVAHLPIAMEPHGRQDPLAAMGASPVPALDADGEQLVHVLTRADVLIGPGTDLRMEAKLVEFGFRGQAPALLRRLWRSADS